MSNEDYLLNVVRNPVALRVVYDSIADTHLTEDDISENTGLTGSNLSDSLTGLRLYGLIESSGYEYLTVDFQYQIDPRLDFQLAMLNNIAKKCAEADGWGQQGAIPLTLAYLFESNLQVFSYSDGALVTAIDKYHQRLGYKPQTSAGRAKLNTDKFNNWAKQAAFLGLIHKAKGSQFTVAPTPELIHATLQIAAEQLSNPVPLEEYIEWLQDEFIYVPLSNENTLPDSFSRVLFTLARRNHISLTRYGDYMTIDLSGVPQSNVVFSGKVNAIEVNP